MPEKDQSTTTASGKDTKAASSDAEYSTPARTGADQSPAVPSATATPDSPTGTYAASGSTARTMTPKDKGQACPTCAGPLERYVGANIHKLLSSFCSKCGVRHHLDAAP